MEWIVAKCKGVSHLETCTIFFYFQGFWEVSVFLSAVRQMGGIIQIFSTSSWNCKINPSTFLNLRHLYKNRSCYFKFTSLKTKKDFSSFIFLNERKHFQELSTLYFSEEFSSRRLPKIILDICHFVERITAQNVADLWVGKVQ